MDTDRDKRKDRIFRTIKEEWDEGGGGVLYILLGKYKGE